MLQKQGLVRTFAALACLFTWTQASASPCAAYTSPGDDFYEGTTVCFVWNTTDVDPLFGTLMGSGDNIFVLPNNFRAEATGVGGADIASAFGFIQVIAKSGFVLDGINVGEIGDYRLNGASTSVNVSAEMQVYDWINAGGPSSAQFLTITGPLNIQDGNIHNWSADGAVDLTTTVWDGVDHVGLSLENILTASSNGAADSAWIQKKAIGSEITVSIDTSPVIPVPAAAWLFASGLGLIAAYARRRAAS